MKSTEEFIRSMAYNAHIVRGDLDAGLDLPESKVIKIGEVSIGIIHGHQIVPWSDTALLASHARAMGVDVLIHGHSHSLMVARAEGSATAKDVPSSASAAASSAAAAAGSTLLLNPGSLTGAYSPFTTSVLPSFLLLAIQGPSVLIYSYELGADGNVAVSRSDWRKAK
jgi:vacuolar protein sorting-associated protein 29